MDVYTLNHDGSFDLYSNNLLTKNIANGISTNIIKTILINGDDEIHLSTIFLSIDISFGTPMLFETIAFGYSDTQWKFKTIREARDHHVIFCYDKIKEGYRISFRNDNFKHLGLIEPTNKIPIGIRLRS
jgi:hypothetical protein